MNSFTPDLQFHYDERLGIPLPMLERDWDGYSLEEQSEILLYWETVRGRIPDRIFALEREIAKLQSRMDNEENFETVCDLGWEIAGLASAINDLWIYFRLNQDVAAKGHH
ncbi:hypothetical protein [Paenibacillus thermotolerans]|uniref:hypothetical protein n=1 Tax=Paenibacillus thermotolerans TaxID=3027807 RepID=UPI002367E89E|nr:MULTISPECIES: hypothetical protein [unclassified Paenibacillus]